MNKSFATKNVRRKTFK